MISEPKSYVYGFGRGQNGIWFALYQKFCSPLEDEHYTNDIVANVFGENVLKFKLKYATKQSHVLFVNNIQDKYAGVERKNVVIGFRLTQRYNNLEKRDERHIITV